jgi:hypothetical protein
MIIEQVVPSAAEILMKLRTPFGDETLKNSGA